MKFKDLAQLSRDEREVKLKELNLELIKLNSQVATGTPPKNAGDIRRIKKDIARIMLINDAEEKASALKKAKLKDNKASKSQEGIKKDEKTK